MKTRTNSTFRLYALIPAILVVSTSQAATWSASGTVKTANGSNLADVAVTVKDSSNALKATSDNNGNFSLGSALEVLRKAMPLDFSVRQAGSEVQIAFPGVGTLDLRLVDLSGTTLWRSSAVLNNGWATANLPVSQHRGAAILRVGLGSLHATQPVTLLGDKGFTLVPRISARSLVTYPTLVFKKVGYADTTYPMNSPTQSGISVVMRDSTIKPVSTCTLPPSPASNGGGSFTWYNFGQGTYKTNGYYQTACGYHGSESGDGSTDKMNNIANAGYFVAIPGSNNFNTVNMCGACVQLFNGSKSIVATVTDECPTDNGQNPPCVDSKHLDVGKPGFDQLGFSVGNPSGTSWKYVACPITGTVVFRIKPGNPNEFFVENTILPVKSVSMNGNSATRTSYGAWHFGSNLSSGNQLTITDYSDRTINYSVSNTSADQDQNTGLQFPNCQ